MSVARNYDDAIGQMQAAGLDVSDVRVGPGPGGKPWRCKVEGDKEKRGWFLLHEIPTSDGGTLICGSFGVWQGAENNAQKIELKKSDPLSVEQREAIKTRMKQDRQRADEMRSREAKRAADRAGAAWLKCAAVGESDYLKRKAVQAYGLRFSPSGACVIPLQDVKGAVHGLQIMRSAKGAQADRRPAKEFWPAGLAKRGHFYLIGTPQHVVLVAEGYATAASLHAATQLPVAVAFDAGNIGPVCLALAKHYKRARILVCGDDDAFSKCSAPECGARFVLADHPTTCPSCGAEHRRANAGANAASAAALAVNGGYLLPVFADPAARAAKFIDTGNKLTDFNDLHVAEGLHAVRTQVEAQLTAMGCLAPARAKAAAPQQGGGGDDALRPIRAVEDLLERFALVYGQGGTVFDRREHCLVAMTDMQHLCMGRHTHKEWIEHHARQVVRVREVGFDPGGDDAAVTCNLWGGWPTKPKAGKCSLLLDLLLFMCSNDDRPGELYDWVLKWIAYPIQHPGAKMKTTVVMHGPQGTGKNLFFEALMGIYGPYGRVIDQGAIEDKFNDWASRKLFLIADEVVARSDIYHIKNKLKAFITGDWIRINPKNFAAYDERNHVNIVFLSNEDVPTVVERDDRRHAVIWTPAKLEHDFYAEVRAEIANGGAEALHDHLLHIDLGDFNPGTLPPNNAAKRALITQSLDSTSRFYEDLSAGEIGEVRAVPALTRDVYKLYRHWCGQMGLKAAPQHRLTSALNRRHNVTMERLQYRADDPVMGPSLQGPHGAMLLGTSRPDASTPRPDWLGQSFAHFRHMADEHISASGGGAR